MPSSAPALRKKPRVAFLSATLVVAVWGYSVFCGIPAVVSALPLLGALVIASVLSGLGWSARHAPLFLFAYPALVACMFATWTLPLWFKRPRVPVYSLIALAVLGALDLLWLVRSWRYGLDFQGFAYTRAVVVANAVAYLLLIATLVSNRRKPTFASNLVFHTGMFVWAAYVAFPYLGESP